MKLLQDDGSLQSKGLATPGLQALIIGIRSTFPAKLVLASDLLLKKMIKMQPGGGIQGPIIPSSCSAPLVLCSMKVSIVAGKSFCSSVPVEHERVEAYRSWNTGGDTPLSRFLGNHEGLGGRF